MQITHSQNDDHPPSSATTSGIRSGGRLVKPGSDEEFDERVVNMMRVWRVPGLSIAVVHGEESFAKGYGLASVAEKTPVVPETLFYGGSTTKAFVAAAFSILVDDDENYPQVKWTTPIHDLIGDDFTLDHSPHWTLHTTIEDALCHRTGMPRYDFSFPGRGAGPRDVVHSLRYLPLTREPRTEFQYCNLMFVVAGYIIERLTGMELKEFLKQRIWAPLGMHSTFFSLHDAQKGSSGKTRLATPHWRAHNSSSFKEIDYMDMPESGGAGNIISNVHDYCKWLRCMINKTLPLQADGHKKLLEPHIYCGGRSLPNGPAAFYCLGWQVAWYHGKQVVWHGGDVKGFGTYAVFIPALSWGVVMFGNIQGYSNAAEIILAWHLIDELLGVPSSERLDWDGQQREKVRKEQEDFMNARQRLYAHADSSLRLTLPLAAYAGPWQHPAFGTVNLTVSRDGKTLECHRDDVTWTHFIRLEHVAGEHFIAYMTVKDGPDRSATKAQFHIAPDGKPDMLHMAYQNDLSDDIIPFARPGNNIFA